MNSPTGTHACFAGACTGTVDGTRFYSTEEVVSYLKGVVDKTGRDGAAAVADAAHWVDSLFADALGEILMNAQITLSCLQGNPISREYPVLPICI